MAYGRPPAYGQVKGARVAAQFIPSVLFLAHLIRVAFRR
jgi:hypothetical protein